MQIVCQLISAFYMLLYLGFVPCLIIVLTSINTVVSRYYNTAGIRKVS